MNPKLPLRHWIHFGLVLLGLVLPSSSLRSAESISVFAAASLSDALKELAGDFKSKTGNAVVLNLGASSLLARQIEEGAPADVFFSADEAKMETLERKSLLLQKSRRTLLTNSLVIVAPLSGTVRIESAKDLGKTEVKRVALAETKTVPAGIYARQYLESQSLWSLLEPKVVPTENVRAALAVVESGNADAAIVYKTDAAISKRTRIVHEVPLKEGPSIQYPVAVIRASKQPTLALEFIQFLESDTGLAVFRRHGFIVRESR